MSNNRNTTPKWQEEFAKEWNVMCRFLKERSKEAGINLKHIKVACKDKVAEYKYM